MGNIYDVVRNVETVPMDVLRRLECRLVEIAIATRNSHLYGVLAERTGRVAETRDEEDLRDVYHFERIVDEMETEPVHKTCLRRLRFYLDSSQVGA